MTHPTGTVTFLFTDIEGSTRLWEEQRAWMEHAFARQESVIREAVAAMERGEGLDLQDTTSRDLQGCADQNGTELTTDQRGAPRPVGARCDIGAFEFGAKVPQTITFGALANKNLGDAPFAVSATSSSGLAVAFTAAGPCGVSGTTVTLTGAGTCTLTGHQAGNVNYAAAADVSQSFTIASSNKRIFLPLLTR